MPARSSASAAVSPPMPPPAMSTRGIPANILDRMRLTLACGRYDRTQALIDGRVRIEGVDELVYLPLRPGETFWRMLNHEEFDASEMSLSSYSILRSEGDARFIAIPVFPSRVFRQNAVYLRADSPIREARDLKGKRIGVGDYQMTAAVWTRGFLQHEYAAQARARHGAAAHVRHRCAHRQPALGDRRDRARPRDSLGLFDRRQPADAGGAGAVPRRAAAHATPCRRRGALRAEREPGAWTVLER